MSELRSLEFDRLRREPQQDPPGPKVGARRPHLKRHGQVSASHRTHSPLGAGGLRLTSGPLNAHADIAGQSLARQANDIARDLTQADPKVYWPDLAGTAAVTWLSFWIAATAASTAWTTVAGIVCILALYRGISFIHELTHLRRDDVPGFHFAWNALIGVPWLTPSLLYEGVHILHHAKDRYGTDRDPEYHPLARRPSCRCS